MSDYLQDVLPFYYNRIYPFKAFYDWLSYGNKDHFSRREFSFTLAGDIYVRFQSFGSKEEFEKAIKNRQPEKIDIGAVYNIRPKDKSSSFGLIPESKEFVLDIDLTDYDDVRSCCTGASVCEKCWKFIALGVEILDLSLREDFGFKHLLWVFSGRRGVHCWVCDDVARTLDTGGRTAIIDYLSVLKGGDEKIKKVKLPDNNKPLHPFLSRAVEITKKHFKDICDEQEVFNFDKNLEVLPANLRKELLESNDKWQTIEEYAKGKKTYSRLVDELSLHFTYPRLDVNVSKGFNHLLKAPFCIHPKTGKVCVPFDPKEAFKFQINEVPTAAALIEQIDEFDNEKGKEINDSSEMEIDSSGKENKFKDAWKKTSIKPYMEFFHSFVEKLPKVKKSEKPTDDIEDLMS